LIAFVSSIIADIQDPFPKYAWWTVAYMLCCIIGITIVFATNSTQTYSIAVRSLTDPKWFAANVDRLLDTSLLVWS
jgi:uncharacterized membrane protein